MSDRIATGKPRKPRPDARAFSGLVKINSYGYWVNITESFSLYPKDCRKLAAWLLKAADYLESKMPSTRR
jgi:hypothetical protein